MQAGCWCKLKVAEVFDSLSIKYGLHALSQVVGGERLFDEWEEENLCKMLWQVTGVAR